MGISLERRSGDRRQGPQREEDRILHYAVQSVVAAAVKWEASSFPSDETRLREAVATYNRAEADAIAARVRSGDAA